MSYAGGFGGGGGAGTVTGLAGDAGAAAPLLGVITIAGGTNLTTAGAANTITVNLDAAIAGMTAVDFANGGRIGTGLTAGNTLLLRAYDVDGTAYTTFATLTANNTPTMDLDDAVTKASNYIYRGGGTDVAVADGGTGASTLTQYGVLVGAGTNAVQALTAGSNGQVLVGSTTANPVMATLGSTGGTISYVAGAGSLSLDVNASIATPTGFATWGGAGVYFDDTTLGEFTVSRPGTGYINGKLISWTAPQTVTGMTAGNTYIIYIDNTGTIGSTTSFAQATFQDYIPLFECMRDSTPVTNTQLTVRENHPYNFPVAASFFDHSVIGPVIENNLNGANITINGTQKIQINGADVLADHGLYTTIPDSSSAAVTFKKYYTTAAGKWAFYSGTDTFSGTWNNAGTPTALTAGRYAVYTLYCSKDNINTSTPTYFAVLDTSEYNSQTAANTAIANGTVAKATAELAKLEVCQLGYIIFRQSTNAITSVVISKTTLRQTLSTGGTNTAALVNTNVTAFNGILSSADTNVQAALDTIDNWGATTTDHAVLIGNGTGAAIGSLTVGSNGQVLLGATTADPAFATLTSSGGTITFTPGANTLNLEATVTAGGLTWNNVTGTTQAMAVNNGYIANNGSQVVCTLPASAAIGTMMAVAGNGAGGWRISQNANQYINFLSSVTATGTGGYLESTTRYDVVWIICTVTDVGFVVVTSIGNITVA
jgi:hypothetical protein